MKISVVTFLAVVLPTLAVVEVPKSRNLDGHDDNEGKKGKKGKKEEAMTADYGPLFQVADEATGLYLLNLPEGFSYTSYGWTGQIMNDGNPTPTDHDGMACVATDGDLIALVRNHEMSRTEFPTTIADPEATYSSSETGGTTNIWYNTKTNRFTSSYGSLAGVIRPCAGGSTPWGTWLAAEENFSVDPVGMVHGYVFEVPGFGMSDGTPIRSAGRFNHEAAAVDPATGFIYQTEDADPAGFYRYVMPGADEPGFDPSSITSTVDGGKLYALAVVDNPSKNLRGDFENGQMFDVEWVEVADPNPINTENRNAVFLSAPGAAAFRRLEGIWYDNGKIIFISTNGGLEDLGQVWVYDPSTDVLTMLYESASAEDVWGPDNVAVAPSGDLLLCEDGGSDPKRLVGLTLGGELFTFAENRIELNEASLDIIDAVYPGTKANFYDSVDVEDLPAGTPRSFTSREWAGATFCGDVLFVNVQSPGVTFAITGPWKDGAFA